MSQNDSLFVSFLCNEQYLNESCSLKMLQQMAARKNISVYGKNKKQICHYLAFEFAHEELSKVISTCGKRIAKLQHDFVIHRIDDPELSKDMTELNNWWIKTQERAIKANTTKQLIEEINIIRSSCDSFTFGITQKLNNHLENKKGIFDYIRKWFS